MKKTFLRKPSPAFLLAFYGLPALTPSAALGQTRMESESISALLQTQKGQTLSLPSILNSNMVLQRQTNALVWGWATAGAQVQVSTSWNGRTYSTLAGADGSWRLKVVTPKAGGPYQMTISSGTESIRLDNILIGEVWVCSGQSNMEMPLKGYKNQPVRGGDSLIAAAEHYPGIRVFRVPKVTAARPQKDCKGVWFENNARNAADFSAVAYQYAKILNEKLQVPVGIIATYWGGTAIQSWMSEQNLSQFPEAWKTNRPDTLTDPEKDPERSPAILYNSMIAPIAGYTIKGFLWYQGESNRYNPLFYQRLMPAMVSEWRQEWKQGSLPFYYVQIAPYAYNWKNDYFSALLRESQLKAQKQIPHSGMAVSLDAGREKFIHPPDKTIIAERLSYWALANTYHQKGIACSGPVLKKAKLRGHTARLYFAHAAKGLTAKDNELTCFEAAGADSVFHPATARIIHGNQVLVESSRVQKLVAVRYAFKNWTEGSLYNREGLPASSFRTDNW